MEADLSGSRVGSEISGGLLCRAFVWSVFGSAGESPFDFCKTALRRGSPVFPNKGREPPFALNAFAYACGFSVCARLAVAKVSSVDLSRRHLDWGKRNFAPNRLNPEEHEFRRGDLFVWLRRLQRCGRRFDTVALDLSTFLDIRRAAFSKRNGTCLH